METRLATITKLIPGTRGRVNKATYLKVRDEQGMHHDFFTSPSRFTNLKVGDKGVLKYITGGVDQTWYFTPDKQETH